ncbi:MAG: hypothetical protein ABSE69_20235 [Roseiarcus sp.]
MKIKTLFVALVGISFLAGPALAGNRLDKTNENKRMCVGKLHAKHVSKANWQGEMDKCAPDPVAYQ